MKNKCTEFLWFLGCLVLGVSVVPIAILPVVFKLLTPDQSYTISSFYRVLFDTSFDGDALLVRLMALTPYCIYCLIKFYKWFTKNFIFSTKESDGQEQFKSISPLFYCGVLVIVIGLALSTYFFGFYDTSVTVPQKFIAGIGYIGGERVENVGLLCNRQNGVIIGVGVAIIGSISMLAGLIRR